MGKNDDTNDTALKKSAAMVSMNVCEKFLSNLYKLTYDIVQSDSYQQDLVSAFKARFRDIDSFRDRYYDAYTVVISQCTSQSAQSEIDNKFDKFMEMYYSVMVMKDNIMPDSKQSNQSAQLIKGETSKAVNFSLPKIHISNFSGNYIDWPNFIALFDSLVHNNCDLVGVQKMHYLINALDKEPLNLIKHLELSDANYLIAYNILKERYDNKRLIADKHLESILSLSSLNNNNHNSSLRKFVNILKENTQALTALGFDVKSWSFILLHIILRKLPVDMRSRFELSLINPREIPSFDTLLSFLENNLRVLETVGSAKATVSGVTHTNSKSLTVSTMTCIICKGNHGIYNCEKFNSMSPSQRKQVVMDERLCFNCLRSHSVNKCLSKSRCSLCQGKHHTKLHIEQQGSRTSNISAPEVTEVTVSSLSSTVQPSVLHSDSSNSTMLLGTALIGVQDVNGHLHKVRALLDSGSQVSIITENIAQKLKLPRSMAGTLLGLGGAVNQRTNGRVKCIINSLWHKAHVPLITSAIVMKKITNQLPSVNISPTVLSKCREQSLYLADPLCCVPGPIDILIGVDLINDVFDGKRIHLGFGMPTAHHSIFGWILMGMAPVRLNEPPVDCTSLHCTIDLDIALSKFWEVEERPVAIVQDPEDLLCEQHFVSTYTRDNSGRFIVRLPFKPIRLPIGDTRSSALKRFYNLERKFQKDNKLKLNYIDFMDDYLNSGHMRLISGESSSDRYYIPHHGVIKDSSSTTKLRAVFDASSPSASGVSLNQVLMSGPKLQHNVEDVILRFRTHAIVFTCDIKQMYRQIRLHDEDCKYQTIFWRDSPERPLQQFELTTVTYGVTSSAYLAMRVVHELAKLNETTHPDAAAALQQDTFVDDIVSGSSSIESAKEMQSQIVKVLAQGGLSVRKWVSNCKDILQGYPTDHLEIPFRFEESGDKVFKILGVEWKHESDSFTFHLNSLIPCSTKRHILSNIARIYDPSGFLAPVIFYAKCIMQSLWLRNDISWDDPLPEDISRQWSAFAAELNNLNCLSIDRFILCDSPAQCHLIGFCDASERGYAAAVYLRVQNSSGSVKIHLLLAKTRVAPTKLRRTIPQLELSGAVLLAELLLHVGDILRGQVHINNTIAWCDSSIVLNWLRTPPHRLKVFEGNRVSRILGLIPNVIWRYIPSELNPADCASRGLLPCEILDHSLWWSPEWLLQHPDTWPQDLCNLRELSDQVGSEVVVNTIVDITCDIVFKYSSFSRLIRIVAWICRFYNNSRKTKQMVSGSLRTKELESALTKIIQLVQKDVFGDQIKLLHADRTLKDPIRRLHPFIDSEGLLRVGGRIRNSELPYAARHPILLPKTHHFTNLVIDYYHHINLHAGVSYLITILRQKFWIISARQAVRHRIFKCRQCNQLAAKPVAPIMGDLPPERVREARPFLKVGIDFAGPFNLKYSGFRNARTGKAYLCVFICLAVKAVHLEVVSDLTTEAFLACFQRFVSKRGTVSDIYTDCGTNFQGAKRHLSEAETFVRQNHLQLGEQFSRVGVNWHMNPPYSPHMGGLWESAVKSAKQLFKRTIGDRPLTFEELTTVFCRIEAVLNSRPLCPLSADPNELEVLTPGHFLIGQPLVAPPEICYEHVPLSTHQRWKLVQQTSQHFWRRWHLEYLHNLQQRWKWHTKSSGLEVGDLVIIKDDNLPPLHWRRGRVLKLHPGKDGITRVVELKTDTGSCLRSVAKVCPLPTCDTELTN